MITIPEITQKILKQSPYLEENMIDGLINLSALARKILPQIRKELYKDVQIGAVIMALKRYNQELVTTKKLNYKNVLKEVHDITVRSNLIEYTFPNSNESFNEIKALLNLTERDVHQFIQISQGVHEIAIIISSKYAAEVKQIFKRNATLRAKSHISALTLALPPENVETPGVYYTIFKTLAWHNLSIIDIVSTPNEVTIFFRDDDIEKAFGAIKEMVVNFNKIDRV